ncbi:3-deoxy-D-manno-octulosonic acid transferase [Oceanicola sp. 502str15]|uniref:3-deoxy-D-manno-octulosonic acid transferase n=1 Tax=Oceanicola sp. 502str15 TaxID=2696061 RepID=UPI0020940E5C|nr:glycosyltransferase N-terminal domain-containing protein [Oceanicola sp. 502str15]MCO6381355.1 3-deoxy-D-manno-octulosonic acid transferase [Oceanicola sp. 502str15]
MPLYRLLLSLAAPLLAVLFALRLLRRAETAEDLRQRLATTDEPPLPGPRLWLHGASNGELAAARGLIDGLLADHPGLHLTITANTTTGRDMASAWDLPRTTARLAPVDLRAVLHRFLAAHRPAALIVIENELWPNRLSLARAAQIPVIVTSARLSARSAKRWALLPGLARDVLSAITLLSAQDSASADRFIALGLPSLARAAPLALKTTTPPPPVDPEALAPLAAQLSRPDTLLAASTHPGEEEQVLAAFSQARATRPGLRLILAPRHARRGAEVAALIARASLPFATRSAGDEPGDAAVYLADTMGEMGLWYALSGLCFTGGSLVEKGGHTPWEPVHFGCALLHGPSCFNQAEAFAALDAAGAALPVADATALAAALTRLDPAEQARMAAAASALAKARQPDLAPLLQRIASTANLPRG